MSLCRVKGMSMFQEVLQGSRYDMMMVWCVVWCGCGARDEVCLGGAAPPLEMFAANAAIAGHADTERCA